MPTLRSTFGCTIPQPKISSQRPDSERTSTSADGSVNGKYDGRKRSSTSRSKNFETKS